MSFFQLAAAAADLPADLARGSLWQWPLRRKRPPLPQSLPSRSRDNVRRKIWGLARLSWRVAGAVDRLGIVAT